MSTGIENGNGLATFRGVAAARDTQSPSLTQDRALSAAMRAAQDGDQDAYRALLKACVPIAEGMVRAQGIRGASVHEVVQDVLLTVHRARATYDPVRPLLPWLRAIAQRLATDHLHRSISSSREVFDDSLYHGCPGHQSASERPEVP
jgi:DNA-directed RNA polymerase specialized sigma24 family protein